MKVLTVIFLLVTLACLVQAKRYPYKALKFLDAVRADILFKANLQPIQEEFTICSWVRKLRDSDDTRADGDLIPIWFNYATPDDKMEILISDDGYYNNLFGNRCAYRAYSGKGTWYHYCMSYRRHNEDGNAAMKVYNNGRRIDVSCGGRSFNVKALDPEGYIQIGNAQQTYGGPWFSTFGGELHKLNIFSKALKASEIETMYREGMCSDIETQYGRRRYLRWEDILLEKRRSSEAVYEIEVPGCEDEPEPYNKWDVLRSDMFYGRELTTELYEELTGRCSYDMLGDFIGAKIDDKFIKHFETYHGNQKYSEYKEKGELKDEKYIDDKDKDVEYKDSVDDKKGPASETEVD